MNGWGGLGNMGGSDIWLKVVQVPALDFKVFFELSVHM